MRLLATSIYFFLLITNFLSAQNLSGLDYDAYIRKYKSAAIREMQLYKIPASITLAQGMIESGCGKSPLALNSLNHFGIKCQKEWTGEKYLYDDDEKNECFRKYKNVDESYRDHSLFLTTRSRYASLFTLSITDYKGWANGLKQAGYATNPDYANILIRLIEKNQLYQLDSLGLNLDATTVNVAAGTKKPQKDIARTKINIPVTKGGYITIREDYKMPEPEAFEYDYTSDLGRKVYLNYDVPFIFAKPNDTWYLIAKEFKIFSFQVYKQNDLRLNDPIYPGQMLYLEPKKRMNPDRKYTIKKGDSMYSISQEKCIKLALLLKYNKLLPGEEPLPGVELKLAR